MKDGKRKTLILSVMAIALLVGIAGFSVVGALAAKAKAPGPGGLPRGAGPGGLGFAGPGPGGAQIAATDDYVYVLRGNTLYQFRPKGLTLTKQYEFPRPELRGPAFLEELSKEQRKQLEAKRKELKEKGASREEIRAAVKEMLEGWGIEVPPSAP